MGVWVHMHVLPLLSGPLANPYTPPPSPGRMLDISRYPLIHQAPVFQGG